MMKEIMMGIPGIVHIAIEPFKVKGNFYLMKRLYVFMNMKENNKD